MHKNNNHEHSDDYIRSHLEEINKGKLAFVILLNLLISLSEAVGGIISSSLALLSDAFHNMTDTSSLILSWIGLKISKKKKDKKKTYGYKRVQIIVAFINSQFLLVISIFLIIEAFKKLFLPVEIKTSLMLIVAIIGFIANMLSVILLHKDSHHSLNIKSSYLHLLGDTISSVGVILGALLMKIFKIYYFDSIITILIAIYIGYESLKIIIKTINILMQSSADLNYEKIKKDIESIPNVNSLHHVHTWLSDEKTIYLEAHVQLCDIPLSHTTSILERINKILSDKYNINHTTIQFEVERGCNKEIFNL